ATFISRHQIKTNTGGGGSSRLPAATRSRFSLGFVPQSFRCAWASRHSANYSSSPISRRLVLVRMKVGEIDRSSPGISPSQWKNHAKSKPRRWLASNPLYLEQGSRGR